jgi:hypothetical protein
MKRIVLIFITAFMYVAAAAQGTRYTYKIEKGRMLFHDNIDEQQKKIYGLDGKQDDSITISKDETINLQIEYALITRVDDLQQNLENDSTLNDNSKKKYLRGLENLVHSYNVNYRKKDYPPSIATSLIQAYIESVPLDIKNQSILPIVEKNDYGVGKILIECFSFPENAGVKPARPVLIKKYMAAHPQEILPVIKNNLDQPFADSMIVVAAKQNPRRFYDFAAANDRLGSRIRNIDDTLVSTISKMARSKSGQLYFPFIDLIMKGKTSFEDVDKVKEDDLEYYRLMVRTRIDYASRMLAPVKDTPMGLRELTERMSVKAKGYFIREINGLHTEQDAVRFKILQPLTAQELYYLCVLGEDEIYTSSYTRGVFPKIFERMRVPRGDSLIMSVHGDYFRKFVKMAAAYNTLDTLLRSMPAESATSLMRAFMFGLEKSTKIETTEDAVDVADSYSSIFDKNKVLAKFMLDEANWNYERCIRNGDRNGEIIYRLEKTLFESADTASKVNLSAQLGIPPVYNVAYKSLADDSGRVIQQVFFYGDDDKDGQNSYINFMAMFRGKPEWAISENSDWVTIKSTKGKQVWIFANKPLYGPDDPDAKAQQKLGAYLAAKNLHPAVFIHRGHSYHVKYSLQQIQPSARVVVLGSCGGYNNLNEVLSISSDAHIISSKQVGTKTVNEPILQSINTTLRNGRNIDWIPLWRDLAKQFTTGDAKEKFDDYIPPYKNLGAIFIKAYRKALGGE